MGVLQRMADIMSANINALLDKAEDPVKMANQMLYKLNEDLAEVKKETATVMAKETDAKRKVDELQSKVNEYKASATKALQAGQEADARTLLQRKQEYEKQLETAQKTYEVAKQNSANMQAMFNKLNSDIATLTERRENVKSQMAMADAQERANKITEKMNRSNATDTFTRMEEKAQRKLDEATAKTQLGGIGVKDEAAELNDKYSSGSSAAVDAELEAMKAELGI